MKKWMLSIAALTLMAAPALMPVPALAQPKSGRDMDHRSGPVGPSHAQQRQAPQHRSQPQNQARQHQSGQHQSGQHQSRQHQDRRDNHRSDRRADHRSDHRADRNRNDRRADQRRDYRRDYRHDSRRDYRAGHSGRNWSSWRSQHRSYRPSHRYHAPRYRRPHGWYYRRWSFGDFLPSLFWSNQYWIGNYGLYDLPPPPPGAVWVRYGDDALLIDRYSGEVIDVVYGIFY